jgi:hypothetical protein
MNQLLGKLAPIPRGTPLRAAMTRERIEAIQDAIIALANGENLTGGNGVRMGKGSGSVRVDVLGERARMRRPKAPFEPDVKLDVSGETPVWSISLAHGWIIERVIPAGGSHFYNEVTGVTPVDGDPVWHEVASGDSLWVSYPVSLEGLVTGDGTVVKSATIPGTDEHYYPRGGIYAGAAGIHSVRVVKFELVSGRPKVTWYAAGSHIDHYAERACMETRAAVEGEVGDRREVLHEYEPGADTYYFRYLVQLGNGGSPNPYDPAEGRPIIKPLGEEEDADEKVAIEFRMLAGRIDGAQIRFAESEDGRVLRVEGNDVWHNVVFQECNPDPEGAPVVKGVLAIRDGLCSFAASAEAAPVVPEGKTLNTTEFTYANCHCCGEGI